MAPDEMESLVTFPIESAINGASGVRRVRSATAVGIAVVWVEFDWGTDIFMRAPARRREAGARQRQRCRRRSSGRSWRRSRRSWARSCSSRSRRTRDDPLTLRTVADTVVRRRLLAVPGVSQVTPIGGAERQFQVDRAPRPAARQQRLADRAARRGARRQPEHVGRHLHRGPAGVRAAGDRPRAHARGDRRERRRAARRPAGARARRRRRARRRGAQARRRLAQRQAGGHRRRAEAAGRQHDRADRAARSRARRAAARAAARA